MLVVARRVGESVLIGDDIEVVVLAIEGVKVRLGIKAPPEVRLLRNELKEASP